MHEYALKHRTIGHILADKAARIGSGRWLIYGQQRFTYAEAHELSNRYANSFRALGFGKGDHVAVMLPNCPEFFWTVWGLGKLGAVAVPLNTAARGEMLRYFIVQSDSCCVVVAAELAGRVAEALAAGHALKVCARLGDCGEALDALGAPVVDLAGFAAGSPIQPQSQSGDHRLTSGRDVVPNVSNVQYAIRQRRGGRFKTTQTRRG